MAAKFSRIPKLRKDELEDARLYDYRLVHDGKSPPEIAEEYQVELSYVNDVLTRYWVYQAYHENGKDPD